MNKIPNIKTFVQNLDSDKRDRDRKLDESRRQNAQGQSEVHPHQETKAGKEGTLKTVHDPTTGKEVQIEDVDADFMKAVENPQVRPACEVSCIGTLADSRSAVVGT